MTDTFRIGNLFNDGSLAVQCDGYHDAMWRGEPHEYWCLIGLHGEQRVQLAPVVETTVVGYQFEHFNPISVITQAGKRVRLLMLNVNIYRFRQELKPPGFLQTICDTVMPSSLERVLPHVQKYNPDPFDLSDVDWTTQYFIRSRVFGHWASGCKNVGEYTLSMAQAAVPGWEPAIEGDWPTEFPKIYTQVQQTLAAAIAKHGADYPARNLLID